MSLIGFPLRLRRALLKNEVSDHPAVAVGAVDDWPVFHAPYDCTVKAIRWIPSAAVTGAATNNFAIEVVDKGADGLGTTSLGSVTFGSGTNASAYDAKDVATAEKLVAKGAVLQFRKAENGTGMAMPKGVVVVEYEIRY